MFIECPNCRGSVSTRSTRCPRCNGPMRAAPRDLTAPVFRWSFILFNALMVVWTGFYLVTGRTSIRPPAINDTDGLVAAGSPLPGEMGLGFLLVLWALGFIVLGLCAIFNMSRGSEELTSSGGTRAISR